MSHFRNFENIHLSLYVAVAFFSPFLSLLFFSKSFFYWFGTLNNLAVYSFDFRKDLIVLTEIFNSNCDKSFFYLSFCSFIFTFWSLNKVFFCSQRNVRLYFQNENYCKKNKQIPCSEYPTQGVGLSKCIKRIISTFSVKQNKDICCKNNVF